MSLGHKRKKAWESRDFHFTKNFHEAQEASLKEAIELLKPKSLIEFGCGYGRLFYIYGSTPMAAFDFSERMVQRAAAHRNPLSMMDINHTGYKDRAVEMVVICTVLMHLPVQHFINAILEACRVAARYIVVIERSWNDFSKRSSLTPISNWLGYITKIFEGEGFKLIRKDPVHVFEGMTRLIFERE